MVIFENIYIDVISENIDIDKSFLKNININIDTTIPENINIDRPMANSENINIDKKILRNIDIDNEILKEHLEILIRKIWKISISIKRF